MNATTLAGITWDHPRGYAGLEALGRSIRLDAPAISWDRQPLEGFESHPVDALAASYDLVVLDHPCLGAPEVRVSLVPLEELFTTAELDTWQQASVGHSWTSYRYLDQQWAVPIDAATQAAVFRPDLLEHPVRTWDDVLALPPDIGMVLCLGGPHALLMLLAIVSGLGSATDDDAAPLLPPDRAREALLLMRELWARSDRAASGRNPIGIHELLAHRDDLALCPLVYSYASYATPASPGARPLRWTDAPRTEPDAAPGSILGGTGLAITRRAEGEPAAPAYIRAYQAEQVQRRLPALGAQPASVAAWHDGANRAWFDHCRGTIDSLRTATVRPRHAGWIPFQQRASTRIRDHLTHDTDLNELINDLNADHASAVVRTSVPGGHR